jgi:uncharacterized protein (TIGR03083 family)
MSERGVKALTAEREEVLKVARSLTNEEWELPSDCDGWRVQDVIVHMADVCRAVVDPGALPEGVPGSTERSMDARVDARREWTHDKVLAEYEDMSEKALASLQGLQSPGVGENVIPLDDLGSYPMHMIANAFAFDHFCHLRNDILKPNGPIDRPVPPSDELRLGATLEWLIAGLPQMSAAAMREAVTSPIGLRLSGPGGGEWTLTPAEGDDLIGVEYGVTDNVSATITSTGEDFIVWGTQRRPWRDLKTTREGDALLAARVMDAINLF